MRRKRRIWLAAGFSPPNCAINRLRVILPAAATEYRFGNKQRLRRDVRCRYERRLEYLQAGLCESGYGLPDHWYTIVVNTAYHCLAGYYEHLERRGTIELIGPLNA